MKHLNTECNINQWQMIETFLKFRNFFCLSNFLSIFLQYFFFTFFSCIIIVIIHSINISNYWFITHLNMVCEYLPSTFTSGTPFIFVHSITKNSKRNIQKFKNYLKLLLILSNVITFLIFMPNTVHRWCNHCSFL